MKRLVLLSLSLAAMACTVSTQPGPQRPQNRVVEQPPPPPPATEVPAPSRDHRHDHHQQPPPPPPPPTSTVVASGFDGRGHTLIAEVPLDARRGAASIPVRSDLTPQRFVLVIEGGDATITDFSVSHGRSRDQLDANHAFRNSARVKEIDFIGNRDTIRNIDVRFRAASGNPTLQVWFANKAPGAEPATWNKSGYGLIGEGKLEPAGNKSIRINSTARDGAPRRLMLVVEGGDAEVQSLSLVGASGKQDLAIGHTFGNDTRTKGIDLQGRFPIRAFEVNYRVISGRPVLQLWAAGIVGSTPAPAPAPGGWDPTGYTQAAEHAFDARRDVANINLKAQTAGPQRIAFQVEGGDVQITDVLLHYGRGTTGENRNASVSGTFNASNASRVIELAGNQRPFHHVEVRYKVVSGRPKITFWTSETR